MEMVTGSVLLLALSAAVPVVVLVGAGRPYRWLAAPRPARRISAPAARRRPIEQAAADRRRLHARVECEVVPVGTQGRRSQALLTAYDDVLVEAVRLPEVPEALRSVPDGMERDMERLRVEAGPFAAGPGVRS